jgi:hypothetical protein
MTDAEIDRARAIADREPVPETWPEELERAREIVRELGDLPSSIYYEMLMRSSSAPDPTDPIADLDAVRGPNAPPYPPSEDAPDGRI